MSDCPSNHPNAPGAMFCTTCGAPISQAPSSPSVQNFVTPAPHSSSMPVNPLSPPSPTPSQRNTPAVVGISIAAVVALGIAAFAVFGGIGGPSIDSEQNSPPSSLADAPPGDSVQLDALWDACSDGDFVACDDLFLESPGGSEYEDFGDTCGGRNDPSGYCEDLYGGSSSLSAGGCEEEPP